MLKIRGLTKRFTRSGIRSGKWFLAGWRSWWDRCIIGGEWLWQDHHTTNDSWFRNTYRWGDMAWRQAGLQQARIYRTWEQGCRPRVSGLCPVFPYDGLGEHHLRIVQDAKAATAGEGGLHHGADRTKRSGEAVSPSGLRRPEAAGSPCQGYGTGARDYTVRRAIQQCWYGLAEADTPRHLRDHPKSRSYRNFRHPRHPWCDGAGRPCRRPKRWYYHSSRPSDAYCHESCRWLCGRFFWGVIVPQPLRKIIGSQKKEKNYNYWTVKYI